VALVAVASDCGAAQRRRARRADREKPASPAAPAASPLVSRVATLKAGGGRLDWHDDKIAFDMAGPDGRFDVYVMRPDGSGERCLTCNHPDLPDRNIGQPAWHPSGRYLVFQAEKQQHRNVRMTQTLTPGAGVLNDLWVLDTQTSRATRIREVKDAPGQGTLHPHFAPDGRQLSWSEMHQAGGLRRGQEVGYWHLMIADFDVAGGRPSLSNVRNVTPGGPGFYENHGFSPDGTRLIFSSNFEARRRLRNDIYVLDLRTRRLTRLTDEGWNEHARFSPDGRHIAWMSNVGAPGGADYWLMNADGSNKRRLTHFNQKGHPDYAGGKTMVADVAWRPDGTAIAGYSGGKVFMQASREATRIVLVELSLK
jgi:Tol biopolymer transport system component